MYVCVCEAFERSYLLLERVCVCVCVNVTKMAEEKRLKNSCQNVCFGQLEEKRTRLALAEGKLQKGKNLVLYADGRVHTARQTHPQICVRVLCELGPLRPGLSLVAPTSLCFYSLLVLLKRPIHNNQFNYIPETELTSISQG